jgi:enoyl-CoA hydratase/carnithine racemase
MIFSKEQVAQLSTYQFAYLKVERFGHLLNIRLNRPEKKNALNPVMVNELAFALAYAHHTREVWCVVLSAEGDVFCAGADLKAFMGSSDDSGSTVPQATDEILIGDLFAKLHKPCIAKVQGPVFAGGFLLLCGCSHVVAVSDAVFGLPEVKRGLWPMQVMASLQRVMPPRKMLDWCMRGYNMECAEAHQVGLVTHIATSSNIDDVVHQLTEDILSGSPAAITLGMEAFEHIQASQTSHQHAYLREMLFKTIQTDDAQEGILAFREKRKPIWKGC